MALPASRKTNFTSSWIFPPPLNEDWLEAWNASLPVPNANNTVQQNATTGPFDILTAAAQNVTASKVFYEQADGSGQGVGNLYRAVGVGDIIQPEWSLSGNDFQSGLQMYCVVCSQGQGREGGIWAACGNYTDTSHTSQFFNTTDMTLISSKTPLTVPPLSSTLQLSTAAVGLCYFLIFQERYTDYSAPFAVTEASHMPHYRFNESYPTGIPDPSIQTEHPASLQDAHKKSSEGGLSKGAVAGTVLGALVAFAVLLGIVLFFLKRIMSRKKNKRSFDSRGGSELQQVQPGGVERRTSHDPEGLPPPAYHEVITAKRERYG